MSVDTFGIEKEFLRDLLKEVVTGHAQLPEFQRGWVWPDKNIASLLASISLGYPAGTLMMRNFRREITADYSTSEREYEACLFPLARVFDPDDWYTGFQEFWDYDREKIKLWNTFNREVIRQFDRYQLPVIELNRDTPRQAVCQVFEKVNTGGVTLTVFELLTATFAADEFDLRRHWEKECQGAWSGSEYRILREVANTDFLQAVTLLATAARRAAAAAEGQDDERLPRIGCKRDDMLKLTLGEYRRFAPAVVSGMRAAAKFLHGQHLFETKYLPYGSQVVPLAAILASLGKDGQAAGAQQKLARWFWCGVFGELYGGTTETRFSRDLPEVTSWIGGTGPQPRTVDDAQFAPGRLLTLRTRGSAAYKGIYALLLKAGAIDWRTGEAADMNLYFDEAIDIHHIFPKAWCEKQGIKPGTYNSIVNKTPLTARTNRVIGGRAPSEYLARLASSAGVDTDTISKHISTHLADADLMARNDFDTFFADRARALLDQIASATGKPIDDIDFADAAEADTGETDDTDDL